VSRNDSGEGPRRGPFGRVAHALLVTVFLPFYLAWLAARALARALHAVFDAIRGVLAAIVLFAWPRVSRPVATHRLDRATVRDPRERDRRRNASECSASWRESRRSSGRSSSCRCA